MVDVLTPSREATWRTDRSRSEGVDFTIGNCNPGVTRGREIAPKPGEVLESKRLST